MLDFIQEVIDLSDKIDDRRRFHEAAKPWLLKMGTPEYIHKVFEMNLMDNGFLQRKWSTYETPFLYLFENNHFYLKYHVFLTVKSMDVEKTTNIIHHHNNYLLSSLAAFGSGYYTIHYDKKIVSNPDGTHSLKRTRDFNHLPGEISFVDSYEPHVVFNPSELSATTVLWSPDKKQITDNLRNHPLVKPFKKLLIRIIHFFGASRQLGVAEENVCQYYLENGKYYAVKETEIFESFKAEMGPEVDDYYINALALFMQKTNYKNTSFLNQMIKKETTPETWKKYLTQLANGEPINEVYGRETLYIPNGEMRKEDLLRAPSI